MHHIVLGTSAGKSFRSLRIHQDHQIQCLSSIPTTKTLSVFIARYRRHCRRRRRHCGVWSSAHTRSIGRQNVDGINYFMLRKTFIRNQAHPNSATLLLDATAPVGSSTWATVTRDFNNSLFLRHAGTTAHKFLTGKIGTQITETINQREFQTRSSKNMPSPEHLRHINSPPVS